MPAMVLVVLLAFALLPFILLRFAFKGRNGIAANGSITMFGVAQHRQLGYRLGLCHDNLALYMVPMYYRLLEWVQRLMWFGYRSIGDRAYGVARCNYIDEVVEQSLASDVEQIVNLGAGLDSRLHRMEIPGHIGLFEVDAPASQAIKRKLLPEVVRRSEVKFVSCDFEKERWIDALSNAGFYKEKNTLFIWEGVVMYLSPEALIDTLEMFGQCGAGSRVVFDYVTPVEQLGFRLGLKMVAWIGEPFLSIPTKREMALMFENVNMRVIQNLETVDIVRKYMTHRDGFVIGRCLPGANFMVAETHQRL